MAKKKRDRFFLKNYFDLPLGWGLYSEYEIEEKAYYGPFLYASKHFKEKFESGDEQAIFTFVKNCPECFREVWPFPDNTTLPCYSDNNVIRDDSRSWVIEQIEKWKAEGSPEAKEKLKKLFTAYIYGRGNKEKSPDEDWRIYKQVKKYAKNCKHINTAIQTVADELIENNKPLIKSLKRIKQIHNVNKRDKSLKELSKKTGIQFRTLKKYLNWSISPVNTVREIYYKIKKLEKIYKEDKRITEKNLGKKL